MTNGIKGDSNEALIIEHHALLKKIATELSIMQDYAVDIQNIFSDVIQFNSIDTITSMRLQKLDLLSQLLDDMSSIMICISADRYSTTHDQQKIASAIKLADLRQRLIHTNFSGQPNNNEAGDFTLL